MITNPAIEVLQRERDQVATAIDEMSDLLKDARAKQKSIDEALALLTGQPIPERGKSGGGPRLNDLILDTLKVDGMGQTPAEIAELLTESGRETANTTVSSMLSRMKKDGEAENRDGRWFLPNPQNSAHITGPVASLPAGMFPQTNKAPDAVASEASQVTEDVSPSSNEYPVPRQSPWPVTQG